MKKDTLHEEPIEFLEVTVTMQGCQGEEWAVTAGAGDRHARRIERADRTGRTYSAGSRLACNEDAYHGAARRYDLDP
ncbi:MAG: hypothetical protein AAB242_12035, partial [Nitrospirota bacterium]